MVVTPLSQSELFDLVEQRLPIQDRDLGDIDWADLPGGALTFRRCELTGGRLTDAALDGATFDQCSFLRCSFASADLSDAKFQTCVFFDTDARKGCDFFAARLDGARFEGCNLSISSFANASLYGATLHKCKASGADFEGASFARKVARTAIAKGTLTDCMLDMANFSGLVLDGCDFSESSLKQADFSRTGLVEAHLRGCNLSAANVVGARLDKADMREATLDGLDLGSAQSFAGIKVSASTLSALAGPLGIRVFPD